VQPANDAVTEAEGNEHLGHRWWRACGQRPGRGLARARAHGGEWRGYARL